ncbi:MAG: M20/M25/M40 family metallo-hydrolase [Blastocatellia bacterium]|nr:M20/M25/M40 family metallo-hydrolase [Blastocatellia bacterium]MDW8255681.1 M20/M25/M40 family metallo-hydrolase [Acidobacteriota bacterium]
MRRRIVMSWTVLLSLLPSLAVGQRSLTEDVRATRERVRAYRFAHERAILGELVEFLSIPNVASDREAIRRNAEFLKRMLERRGIRAEILQVGDAPPAVYGELLVPNARRTIVFYAHFDGQPVDPSQWASDPWKPVLRDRPLEHGGREIPWSAIPTPIPGEWRLYARSASDDKSPIVALLVALDALRAAAIPLSVNLKFFFEGEEEAGSPHLRAILQKYADRLKADAWVLCDGPVHQTRRQQVYFGARGIVDLELTVYGPVRPLHSGHYGNWAPNPAALLAHLLASMRDENGRIRIAGFYDDVRPLTESERRALAETPDIEASLREELGLGWSEGEGRRLVELIMAPALNVRGLRAGHVGETAQNAIPTEATASIDFRLVPDQTPESVRRRVEEHIRQQGFTIVSEEPTLDQRRQHPRIARLVWGSGYPPARTSMDLPVSRAIVRLIEETVGAPIVKMPTLGGSIPMYLFQELLQVPIIGVPIVNHDNNQHAANENLRIQNFWDGIELYAALFAHLGRVLEDE